MQRRETAHKIPWGKNSTWGRSFMTLGLVPLCCSPGHISAIFRQQTIFPSEWSMAISMRSYRSWSQLFHRSILSFSFRSLPCLPIPLHFLSQASNRAPAWARCPADQQLLDPTYLYFLCNVVSIWIRLIFTLLVVSINLPQASYFLLNFLQSEHRGSFVFSLCEQTEGWFPFHFSIACFWAVPSWEWKWSILL